MHENNVQVWLIGAIDTATRHVRLDVTTVRNAINLKNLSIITLSQVLISSMMAGQAIHFLVMIILYGHTSVIFMGFTI